jgi:hypothetical protein
MIERTAFNQLNHSTLLLIGTVVGWLADIRVACRVALFGIAGCDSPGNRSNRIDAGFVRVNGSLPRIVSNVVARLTSKRVLLSLGHAPIRLELPPWPRWSMEGPRAGSLSYGEFTT